MLMALLKYKLNSKMCLLKNRLRVGLDISQKDIETIIWGCGDIVKLGLGKGKMNLVLFLYICGMYYKKESLELLADDVLNDIYREVSENSNLDLCELYEVGCGIEFLIQFELVCGNSDMILNELDMKVMEQVPFTLRDYNLLGRYEIYICYILCRLISPRTREYCDLYPFGRNYLEKVREFILKEHLENRRPLFMCFIKYMSDKEKVFNWNNVLSKSFLINKYEITV